jgi:hypothetical protein
MMTMRDSDPLPWPADPQREAAALTGLRAEFPGMDIASSYYGTGRAWLARGANGRPWLVMSDDLARFRAMLQGYVRAE